MFIDQKQRQSRVAEAPDPDVLAVDAPAGFIGVNHGFRLEQLEQPPDHGIDQLARPHDMAERPGATQLQPEDFVQQRDRLAQRQPQMRSAISH